MTPATFASALESLNERDRAATAGSGGGRWYRRADLL
jgi:hypothetical protein